MMSRLMGTMGLVSLVLLGLACQSSGDSNTDAQMQCCVDAEALIAQIPDCCKADNSPCCVEAAGGAEKECCQQAASLKAKMAPCCRNAMDDPASADACCSSMNK